MDDEMLRAMKDLLGETERQAANLRRDITAEETARLRDAEARKGAVRHDALSQIEAMVEQATAILGDAAKIAEENDLYFNITLPNGKGVTGRRVSYTPVTGNDEYGGWATSSDRC